MAVRKRQVGLFLSGLGTALCAGALLDFGGVPVEVVATLGGVLLAAAGVVVFLERRSAAAAAAHDPLAALEAARQELDAERASVDQFRKDVEAQLETRAHRIEEREAQLAGRLIAFQEWLEYPSPENDASDANSGRLIGPELEIRDRRVIELLETEAKFVYERIRDGRYRENGQLKIEAIRNDTLDLIERVARIYQPDGDHPLLETSVDKLLRAGSRVCLHLLVVLERLPLDLHEENFSTLHDYMRKAVKAYDVYSAAEPYLGYASKALYAGRLAMGANPLTLGITWALSELGRRGAKAVGQKFIDQQAIALLGDLVRVIGFEVAGIYGGDFRHRDPNWVYGSELTELMSRFPVSHQNLAHALREIGALTFRNEYDRVFLYRCLSTHRSARPAQTPHEFLPPDMRQGIARKLESFFRNFIHGKTERTVTDWQSGVETRLGLRLRIEHAAAGGLTSTESASGEAASAIQALVAFATAVKGRSLSDLSIDTLAPKTAAQIGTAAAGSLLQAALAAPPQFFDGIDLDPQSKLLDACLSDLIRLAVQSEPRDVQPDDLVLEAAVWLGRDAATIRKQIDTEYSGFVGSLLPDDAPTRKVAAAAARVILGELLPQESLRFAYPDVRLRNRPGVRESHTFWLAGTNERLLLIDDAALRSFAATPIRDLSAAKGDGLVISGCELTGGEWALSSQDDAVAPLELSIAGGMMTRFETWFRPLLDAIRNGTT